MTKQLNYQNVSDNLNELFIVVDRNDKITDYYPRRECHQNKNLIHRSFVVIIFNHKKEVLLQKRSQTKDMYPGYFTSSCGGHVLKGETYEEAAHRELKEELGIDLSITFVTKKIVEKTEESEMAAMFKGFSNGPFKIAKDEIDNIQFFTTSVIRKKISNHGLLLTPTTKVALRELKILP